MIYLLKRLQLWQEKNSSYDLTNIFLRFVEGALYLRIEIQGYSWKAGLKSRTTVATKFQYKAFNASYQ